MGDERTGKTYELFHVKGFIHVANINEMMPDSSAFGRCRLGRPDVHAPVDLHRVGGNNLDAEHASEFERNGALADGGRADEEDGWHVATICNVSERSKRIPTFLNH